MTATKEQRQAAKIRRAEVRLQQRRADRAEALKLLIKAAVIKGSKS